MSAVFVALILAGAAIATTGSASADCGIFGCNNVGSQSASNTATVTQAPMAVSGPTASVGALQVTVGGDANAVSYSNLIQKNIQRLYQINFAP
jgi:hypothetical protein